MITITKAPETRQIILYRTHVEALDKIEILNTVTEATRTLYLDAEFTAIEDMYRLKVSLSPTVDLSGFEGTNTMTVFLKGETVYKEELMIHDIQ